jgi:hypothetical protein
MSYYWCSVVENAGFLGCCIVKADSDELALRKAKDISKAVNGEIAVFQMPKSEESLTEIKTWGVNKLFDPHRTAGYKKIKDLPEEQTQNAKEAMVVAHVKCLEDE